MKVWMLSLMLFPAVLVAGEALSCNNDVDCACGQVCSWAAATHVCVEAVDGGSGWCGTGNTNCLYAGQTCSTNSCTPAWSSTSVCNQGSDGGSSGGSSGGSDGGTSSSGGGCTSAPGQVGWAAALLALGLLRWSRRRPA